MIARTKRDLSPSYKRIGTPYRMQKTESSGGGDRGIGVNFSQKTDFGWRIILPPYTRLLSLIHYITIS